MRSPALLLVLAVVFAAILFELPQAAAQEPVAATIAGPDALAPSQTTAYNLTLSGGPAGSLNYTIRWYATGPDVSGALPDQSTPSSTTGNRTAFKLNVTAPPREQEINLVVLVSAKAGSRYENTTVQKTIVVVTPITLTATFRNDASTAALNVTVRFYIDNRLAGTQKIARIGPRGQVTASFDYLPVGLQPGSHAVRIEADLDGDGRIDPARGELLVSDLFYRYTPPLSAGWTILIGIAVFVPVLLVTIAFRRRQQA